MEGNVYDSDDDEAPMLVSLEQKPAKNEPEIAQEEQTSGAPCPVTILSGFLGAGKTTLVQYILSSPDHGKRIAIIENEFGGGNDGLSVESMIARDGVSQDSLTDLIELPNGCICCTVKDSLVATLENLIQKKRDLDYIIIEASGMANPGPIASLFWLDEALESRLRLDGVVTLVDAANLSKQLDETEEAAQQIAYADRILFNKVDLVPDQQQQDSLRNKIRAIHPTVPIRPTTFSQVPDLDWILDANCYDADRAKEVDQVLSQLEHDHEHDHDHDSSCADPSCTTCVSHTHTSAVSTCALVEEGSMDLGLVHKWLASILWPNQDERDKVLRARLENDEAPPEEESSNDMHIFRIKGILSIRHDEVDTDNEVYVNDEGLDSRRYIVQAVHDLWEIHAASDDLQWNSSDRSCKLVVIGKHLNEDELKRGFSECLYR